MQYSLVIQYFYPVSFDSTSLFFRVEQELEKDDPPSVDEVAQAIDAVTGQDFCKGTVAKNGYQPPENKSPAEQQVSFRDFFSEKLSDPLIAQDFAQRLGIKQPCKAALGESITIPLKIFWQTLEIAENYRLASTANVDFSKPVFIREKFQKEFKISEASEKNIEYYIEIDGNIPLRKQIEFNWVGNVVDENKNIVSGPTGISIENNAIVKWGQRVSGTFVIKFKTVYHSVQAEITPMNGDYSATVYGVWAGPAVSLDLVVPEKKEDDDCPIKDLLTGEGKVGDVTIADEDKEPEDEVPEVTCFWLTTHELRQPCGDNELIDRWETIDIVKCPDDIADRTPTLNSPMSLGYIEEIESRYYYEIGKRTIPEYISTSDSRFSHDCEACTEEGFQKTCCRERASVGGVLEPIPPCLEIKSTFYGGVEIKKGREHWKQKYPGGVVFQEKLPKEGYCGNKSVKFETQGCCHGVSSIEYLNTLSPETIHEGGVATVYFTGGLLPFFVELNGTGFYLDSDGTQTEGDVNSHSINIYARNSCGSCEITASDNCDNQDTGLIRSSEGRWVTISDTLTGDGNYGSCVIGKYRYTDDWCDNRPGYNTCTGTGTQYCSRPPSLDPESANSIEGNKIEEWQC